MWNTDLDLKKTNENAAIRKKACFERRSTTEFRGFPSDVRSLVKIQWLIPGSEQRIFRKYFYSSKEEIVGTERIKRGIQILAVLNTEDKEFQDATKPVTARKKDSQAFEKQR